MLNIKARRLLVLTAVLVVLGSSVFLVIAEADASLPNGTVRIMPLGDSITYGYPGNEGYRNDLYQDLVNSSYNVDFVGSLSDGVGFDNDHEGHTGWHTDQIRNNVYDWLVANPADVVLLHIGTNDIMDGQAPSEVVVEAQGILNNIDQWQSDYGETVTVILARIILSNNEALTPAIRTYNNALEAMVSTRIANGDRIITVDMQNALSYSSDLVDEFHPTPTGYAKMANVWYDALVDLWAEHTLTITVDPPAAGSVTTNKSGPYNYFDVVTLTPNTNAGYTFNNWSGDGADGSQNTRIITITGNMTVTATFTQNQYTLTLNHTGEGTITKFPNQTTYTYGTVVSLEAVADADWNFDGWSGNLTGSTNPAEITIAGNMTVTATFIQKEYTLSASAVGSGSVTRNVTGPYHLGDVVELTAVPDVGWRFAGWSGGLTGSTNPAVITVNSDVSVKASFVQEEYTLTISIAGNGSVSRSSSGPYHLGDVVTLTANPNMGWYFSGWSEALSGGADSVTITIGGNEVVTATFLVSTLTVSVTPESAHLTIGESLTFSVSIAGGHAPYVFQWFLNGEAVVGATDQSWDFKPNATGNYSVYVQVMDRLGDKSQSNTNRNTYEVVDSKGIADVVLVAILVVLLVILIAVLFVVARKYAVGRRKGLENDFSGKKTTFFICSGDAGDRH